MKYIEGNLIDLAFEGRFDIIIHGCNIFHTFGSGIAAEIAKRIPDAYKADKMTPYGSKEKLGTFSAVIVPNNNGNFFTVVNLYTQGSFGKDGVHVVYEALENGFTSFKAADSAHPLRIGIPMIGAGLGGGDWERIESFIDGLEFADLTCVVLPNSQAAQKYIHNKE